MSAHERTKCSLVLLGICCSLEGKEPHFPLNFDPSGRKNGLLALACPQLDSLNPRGDKLTVSPSQYRRYTMHQNLARSNRYAVSLDVWNRTHYFSIYWLWSNSLSTVTSTVRVEISATRLTVIVSLSVHGSGLEIFDATETKATSRNVCAVTGVEPAEDHVLILHIPSSLSRAKQVGYRSCDMHNMH